MNVRNLGFDKWSEVFFGLGENRKTVKPELETTAWVW